MRLYAMLMVFTIAGFTASMAFSSTVFCQQASATDPTGYFQQSYSIADHVHLLRQGASFHVEVIGNVTVVEQADGLVLIDAGGSPGAGRRVVELVHGISTKPVKAIVITHWHGDHHFGLSEVLKEWPHAMVIATASAESNMNKRGLPAHPDAAFDAAQKINFDRLIKGFTDQSQAAPDETERKYFAEEAHEEQLYSEDFRGISIRYANVTFADHMSLLDDAAPVEIMFLGKTHTDGDAIVWLPKQKVVVTGDAVVSPVPFWRSAYPVEWISVLEKIRSLGYRVLIPGHGVPQTDTTYVDTLIATLQSVNTQVAALAGKGLSLDETQASVDLSSSERAFAGTDPKLAEQVKSNWIPLVACSYAEAEHIPIVQGKPCGPLQQ